MAEPKKRLPVLRETPEEEQGEEPRPPWHWVGFGVCVAIGVTLPLSYAMIAFTRKVIPESEVAPGPLGMALMAVAPLLGGLAGGFLVGRWGGDNAGVREATMAGGVAQLIMVLVAVGSTGFVADWRPYVIWALLIAASAGMAWLGGKIGLRRRIRAMTPNVK